MAINLKGAAGALASAIGVKIPGLNDSSTEGGKKEDVLSTFVNRKEIDGKRWNKQYPYSLKIHGLPEPEKSDGSLMGTINALKSPGGLAKFGKSMMKSVGDSIAGQFGLDVRTNKEKDMELNEVILPIAPSNISISTPVASNLTVTLGGILEEHNGAPLRTITISGTTGVAPVRPDNYGNKGGLQNALNKNIITKVASDIFSSTIKQADNFLGGPTDKRKNQIVDLDLINGSGSPISGTGVYGTGYYHFHKLVNFLDRYLILKKQKSYGRNYLLFKMTKDQMFYKCSLRSFNFQKRSGTLEYDYTIVLTAWDYSEEEGIPPDTSRLNILGRAGATADRLKNLRWGWKK
jgi:hypothetical protein